MGWGRTLLLGDIGNRLDIADTEKEIENLRIKLANLRITDTVIDQTIKELIVENAQMKLYLASLIRLLLKKGNITEAELETIVDAIDAEDGEVDGMYRGDIV